MDPIVHLFGAGSVMEEDGVTVKIYGTTFPEMRTSPV